MWLPTPHALSSESLADSVLLNALVIIALLCHSWWFWLCLIDVIVNIMCRIVNLLLCFCFWNRDIKSETANFMLGFLTMT